MLGRAAALAPLLLVALSGARPARADVAIAPSETGQIGVWLVAGALPEARCPTLDASSLAAPKKAERFEGATFRLLSTASGALDLERALGAGNQRGPCAVLAAALEVDRDFDGWLLVSADGPTRIFVGGKPIFAEPNKKLRDGAWDAIGLSLPKGRHALVVHTTHPGDHWAVAARLLDRQKLSPPAGVRWTLPGTSPSDAHELAAKLMTLSVDSGLTSAGYRPRLTLSFENGAPRAVALPASVELVRGGERAFQLEVGAIAVGARAAHPLEVQLPRVPDTAFGPSDAAERLSVRARAGPASAERSLVVSRAAPKAIADGQRALRELAEKPIKGFIDPAAVRATLAWRIARLMRVGTLTRAGTARLDQARRRLAELVADVGAGRDPLTRPGWVNVARISELDGEPEPLLVHVPASLQKDAPARYPLVVVLHGYNGTPSSVMSAFLDVPETRRGPKLDGFVLAPNAYGNAFYRGPGEHEVLSAIDWALATYPIDRDRVSITGVSMGGTGSAFVALRHPDRFSAASPLCGYHSYFVRRDTSKRPIRPWETHRMHHWSPASWAENGRNLPLFVAHGTKDHPLDNSRVLIERYRALTYDVTDEWPDIGHSVWEKIWDGARMWPWLTNKKKNQAPSRVTLRTDALATARQSFARIVRLSRPGEMATLDAEIESPTRIKVSADGVAAFALERSPKLAADRPVRIELAATALEFAPGEPIAATARAGTWTKGASEPRAGEKRAGVEGPIRAVFDGPLVFVWGSGDPSTARANREVAEAFARTRHGPSIQYRVLSDVELDRATEAKHGLFLVGTASDHRLLGQIGGSFPIRVRGATLSVGDRSLSEPGTGAIFVHPNPRHPEKSVVVVTGIDAAAIWRALSLPQLLPDFLVYDARLSPASAEQILSDGRVVLGGFFDDRWRLPADPKDSKTAP